MRLSNASRVFVIRGRMVLGVRSLLGGTPPSRRPIGPPFYCFPGGASRGIMQSRDAPMGFLRDHNDTRAKRRPTNPKRHGRATLSKGDKLGVKRQIGTLKSLQVESWPGPRTGHPNALAQEYGLTYAGSDACIVSSGACRRRRCVHSTGVLHRAAHAGAWRLF